MQTLTTSLTVHSTPLVLVEPFFSSLANSDPSLKSNQFLEDIDPGTLMVLAEIEAERDYYESCGRW
jgi:hypothetical protein